MHKSARLRFDVALPPQPPLIKVGLSGSLPFLRGGLGWGKDLRSNSNNFHIHGSSQTGEIGTPEQNGLLVMLDTTRLVDTSGEQYKSSLINEARVYAVLSLVKDVPIKISATFMDMPTSVQDVALFEIDTRFGGKGQLRNIKITESKIGTSPSPIKKKK